MKKTALTLAFAVALGMPAVWGQSSRIGRGSAGQSGASGQRGGEPGQAGVGIGTKWGVLGAGQSGARATFGHEATRNDRVCQP